MTRLKHDIALDCIVRITQFLFWYVILFLFVVKVCSHFLRSQCSGSHVDSLFFMTPGTF